MIARPVLITRIVTPSCSCGLALSVIFDNELNELASAGKKSLAISIRKIRINKQQRAAKIREIRAIRGKKILTKIELLFHIVEKNFFQLLLISFQKYYSN